jgi:glycosyltransferase involved in cell wall biosynthesis
MQMALPLVTIVGLCYNHDRYVLETLESIREQSYQHLQVILIDDCSKDNSVSIVETWLKYNRLDWTFIRHEVNIGVTRSLNETLELAQGKYYKAIACDDVLMPNFISTMVERFDLLPDEYAMIYSDVQTINENSEVFGSTPFSERGWDTDEKVPSGELFDQLAGWCFIPAPGTLLRTRVLQEIRFDENLMIEDWDMWLQIAKRYKIKGIARAMVKYRIHSASMFQQKSPEYRDHELRTLEKHLGHSQVGDEIINNFIYNQSIILFLNNGNRSEYWLQKRFLQKKTFKNLFKYLKEIALSKMYFK